MTARALSGELIAGTLLHVFLYFATTALTRLGEVHLETAARLDSALAAFARGYASQFCDKSLDHAAWLGVLQRHSGKRAAVAPTMTPPS
jgi:hypothetical protein